MKREREEETKQRGTNPALFQYREEALARLRNLRSLKRTARANKNPFEEQIAEALPQGTAFQR